MIGVIYKDFELGEPFDLGEKGTFIGEKEGQLLVRCRDSWTSLSDNEVKVTLFIRRTPKSDDSK